MHRLLVALLAALDAVVAAAVGVAMALVPLTLLWVFGLGAPVWAALWPASAAIWQLGHLVPLSLHLPAEYLTATGIPADAASFTLSLAPLAFASFTAAFAARSGRRAARAGAWGTGVLSGAVVLAVLAAVIWLTSRTGVSTVHGWQAVLFPVLVFALPALAGAVVTAWQEGDGGLVDRLRGGVEAWRGGWGDVPGLAVRGAAIAVAGLVGLGALAVAVAVVLRGGQAIALYEAGHVDVIGVIVLSLAQLAYLPTLVVWGLSFVAGPGFAVGAGTAVSPAGTQLGVVPGIPVLGVLPESASPWLLTLVMLPIAAGAFAGWAIRSRLAEGRGTDAAAGRIRSAEHGSTAVRLALAALVAVLSALAAALLALLAGGSMGPDRLAQAGPEPGPVALAVGVEVLVGAGILLLSPRRDGEAEALPARETDEGALVPAAVAAVPPRSIPALGRDRAPRARAWSEDETAPIDPGPRGRPASRSAASEDETETAPIDPGLLGGPGAERDGGRPPVD